MKKGSLVVVGTGIKSVGHITLESRGWIKQADVVLYCVADPATEIWIKNNSQMSVDLYSLYGNDKRRLDTYNEMVDEMLKYVRGGKDTCGVFYGHPGVFVYPSHKAISIARSEGYRAGMLPAISALDCLFADLGVDPSMQGSQTLEATDALLRKRSIQTDGHVIIWQIGCVGDLGFKFAGYDARNLHVLVEYLETFYDPDHVVTHYQGSQFPICPPIIEKIPLRKLRDAKVTGISTLYIPPAVVRGNDFDMVQRLGLAKRPGPGATADAPATATEPVVVPSAYTQYMPTPNHSGLATFIAEIAQEPQLLAAFRRNPKLIAATRAVLTETEMTALLSGHSGRIRLAMKNPKPSTYLDGIAQVAVASSAAAAAD